MQRVFAAFLVFVMSSLAGFARGAPKPPAQFCLVWVSSLDAEDTWEMNLVVRAVSIMRRAARNTSMALFPSTRSAAIPKPCIF